ncbi:hypothetical protein JVU11DRAFT_8091 [Chiua virens]|nr:hypothetical protein JVU11DRAFT_8091 [Chiua virens]
MAELETRIDSILSHCHEKVSAIPSHQFPAPSDPADLVQEPRQSGPEPIQTPLMSCHSILRQQCPACFGGNSFGRPSVEGADIHHRHCQSAGDGPMFYQPKYFIPKTQVDAVGKHIEKACKCPVQRHQTCVPDEAVDHCKSSYEAADGMKQKMSMESFNNTGLMALICHHDIPLFFMNIDTLGEQQKYCITLLEHLFLLLPQQATVAVLYDIGCVIEHSISQVCTISFFIWT